MFSFLYHCQDFYRTWLYARVTRRMSYKKHKLLIIREHLTTGLQPCFWWGPCYVFLLLFVFVLCTIYCQFLWIVHFWLPVAYSFYLVLSEYTTIIIHRVFLEEEENVARKHKILLWTIPLMTFGPYLRRRYGGFPAFNTDDVYIRDSRGCHRMVVEFTTTCAISAYHH